MSNIRNHIHLSDTLGDSPEFAPTHTWAVRADGRWRVKNLKINLTESLNSYIALHMPMVNGSVYVPTNWRFILRIGHPDDDDVESKLAILEGLIGKRLYFCDSFHPADGEDHTSAIQRVRIIGMAETHNPEDPLQRWYWQQIDLIDATRDLDP